MSGCEDRGREVELRWRRCSGGVALPGADPKTAARGLAPKQTAINIWYRRPHVLLGRVAAPETRPNNLLSPESFGDAINSSRPSRHCGAEGVQTRLATGLCYGNSPILKIGT